MAALSSGGIAHWDEVRPRLRESGYLRAEWTFLGSAAGSFAVGVNRLRMEPGKSPNPPHRHGGEEEIFYVLDGSGLSWQDGATCEVRAGDCIVHVAGREAHTLRAGDDGLDVLAFGQRTQVELCRLPRAEVSWLGIGWVSTAGPNPWEADAALGPPDYAPPGPRPANVVNAADVSPSVDDHGSVSSSWREVAGAAGSVATGMSLVTVPAGKLHAPPHCHSAEEEIVVVLGGAGALLLGDEEIAVRRGHVVARPAGTGVAHALRAGEEGLEMLVYGTRDPSDICYYPRSGKINIRGVGVIGRIQPAGYWDGED